MLLAMASLGTKTARQDDVVWSSRMSARGVEFLENWIAKNVPARHQSDDPLRAYNLAARCIVEAAAEGITLEEINTATDSLETKIFDAMAHLAEPGTTGD